MESIELDAFNLYLCFSAHSFMPITIRFLLLLSLLVLVATQGLCSEHVNEPKASSHTSKNKQEKINELLAQSRQLRDELERYKMRGMSDAEIGKVASEIDQYEKSIKKSPDDLLAQKKLIAIRETFIDWEIENYNRGPKKSQITPSTKSVGHAMYYKYLQEKIEKIGTCKFPKKDGEKLYGDLIVYIPIYQDGSIYLKDGGARVEKGSGNEDLDTAALDIIKRAAPFKPIPEAFRTPGKEDVWEIITRFEFTHTDNQDEPETDCTDIPE